MLVPMIRRSILYNLQRAATCVISKIKVTRYYNESNLLSISLPHLTARRIYSTEHDSDSEQRVILPMLVEGAHLELPSFITPLKLLYLSLFKIIPHIDKEFEITKVLQGAKYASIVISKALANKNFETLQGLVTDEMIEILSKKIETLSRNERQLIELNENDIILYVLCNILATIGSENSIEITTVCYYIPGINEKRQTISTGIVNFTAIKPDYVICNYKFTRKYVNNVGGPWIATLVNHCSGS